MKNYSSSYVQQRVSSALVSARLELAKRELARRTRTQSVHSDDMFFDFLTKATKEYVWDRMHQVYIRKQLQRIERGEINKLILELPPRHGKSEMVTVRWPIYRMVQDPTTRVIVGAYNQTLATKFTRKSKRIAADFLNIATDRNAAHDWETINGGGMLAVGVGSGVTGHGAHLIMIDDPVKSREEAESRVYREKVWDWYRDDLYTRLEPGGAIVLTMTRWHTDDLVGRILKSEDADQWEVVRVPALAEENDPLGRAIGEALWADRYDADKLAAIKKVLGVYSFEALYQQNPRPKEGKLFKEPTFYDKLPESYRIIGGVDTAYTASTKANKTAVWIAAMAPDKRCYILYVESWQKEYDYTVKRLAQLQAKYKCRFAIESNGPQKVIVDMIEKEKIRVDRVYPQLDKYARSQESAAAWNRGDILLPREGAWVDDYIRVMTDFTGVDDPEDDEVDATNNAYNRYTRSASLKV